MNESSQVEVSYRWQSTAKPRLSHSDAKRLRILQAGRAVFLEHGLQAASMDLVAATAGVSKTTIYSKFGSKQDLLSSIVTDVCEQILAMEIVIPQTAESTHDVLVELAADQFVALLQPERYYVLLDPDMSPSAGDVERIARAGAEVFLSHYAAPQRH